MSVGRLFALKEHHVTLYACVVAYEEEIRLKMYKDDSGNWICADCGKVSRVKNNISEHIEARA